MISPTLLGKLQNSRAIRIKWCGTKPYALARSSQITCSSILSPLAESIEFHIICECSRHPGKPVIPAFWTDVFIWFLITKVVRRRARTLKIVSLLYLGGILDENLWYLLTAFPLVSRYHRPDTIPVVQYPSSKPAEGGQWVSWVHVGSFYITCTISHSSPGHYLRGPYGRNLELLVLSRYHQTLPLDLGILVNLLEEVLGYHLNHLSMSSSNDFRVPPSVHRACHSLIPRKVFCESIRIWGECSPSLTLFLSMFSQIFSSGDHQNPFLNMN